MTGGPREPEWHEGWAFRLLAILLGVYLLGAILASYPLASYAIDLGMVVACVIALRRIAGGATAGVGTWLLGVLLVLHWLAPILFDSESAWWRPIGSLALLADPAAFALNESDLADPIAALTHFSFTALTTVAFGAIAPVSKVARTLADLEPVVGTLYIAVVLARLVSLQITHAGADVSRRTG